MAIVDTGEVAGSATAAAFPHDLSGTWVCFKALPSNAGNVYVAQLSGVTKADGTSDTTTGWILAPGDTSPWFHMGGQSLTSWYRICDNAGDDVIYAVM